MKNKKIKFLYVTREKYPTYRVDLTQLFSNGIAKLGHDIDWYMDVGEDADQRLLQENSNEKYFLSQKIFKKGLLFKFLNKCFSFWHSLKVFKFIINNEYDFIQVRDEVLIALIALIAARKKKVPFYYWLSFPHSEANVSRSNDYSWLNSPIKKIFFYLRGTASHFILYKLIFPRADFVFVQSERMLDDLAKEGVSVKKMMPVPMGINLEHVDLSKPKKTYDKFQNKKVLIYLGTMIHERRIDFLLDMLPSVIKKIPNILLLLIGKASKKEMKFLKQRAIDLGINDYVIFTGFVPMEEAWNYIRNSDIGLSPFRPSPILDSTSPTKLVEYMAWGIPVVANTHPDQSCVINESRAGFAVEYKPEAFAKACIDILSQPEKAQEMGRLGIEYVSKNRSYAALSARLEKKYFKLLEK